MSQNTNWKALELMKEAVSKANEPHNQDYRPVIINLDDITYVDCALYADTLKEAYEICRCMITNQTIVLHFNHMDIDIDVLDTYEQVLEKYNRLYNIQYNINVNRKYEITLASFTANDRKKLLRLLQQLYSYITTLKMKESGSIVLKEQLSYQLYHYYTNTKKDIYMDKKIEEVKQYMKTKI